MELRAAAISRPRASAPGLMTQANGPHLLRHYSLFRKAQTSRTQGTACRSEHPHLGLGDGPPSSPQEASQPCALCVCVCVGGTYFQWSTPPNLGSVLRD